jgi:SAM-dependent methyltransferase
MTQEYPSTRHFDAFVTDRSVEEPWVIAKVRAGERVLDVGSATSRYLQSLTGGSHVVAIDLRPTPPQPGVTAVRGDVTHAPFRPATFDTISCISTVEHAGCDVYGQGPDQFGDEMLMRHMRALLRPGGRLLITAPYGRRSVNAWFRVYDAPTFRRLVRGYRPLAVEYRRRVGDAYVPCSADELEGAGFDWVGVRSNGVVLAELTPEDGLPFTLARISLRVRRRWARLRHRRRTWRFWDDP